MRAGIATLIGIGIPVACAGASSDPTLSRRMEALEERLARIESQLRPDASLEPTADAAVAVVADAAMGDERPRMWAVEGTPDEVLAQCLADAPRHCQHSATFSKRGGPSDGGYRFTQIDPKPDPQSTPEGRKCLAEQRRQCEKRRDARQRRIDRDRWLDAQLESDKLDRAFSAELEQRIQREMGLRSGDLKVGCTREFCRFTGRNGAFDGGRDIDRVYSYLRTSRGSYMTGNDANGPVLYGTRQGFQFPEP